MRARLAGALIAATVVASGLPAGAATAALDGAVPHYDHIIVIVEENKGYSTILEGNDAPNMVRLAHEFGSATQMYAERHPSEPNYVAMLGGDTFGIADDAPWYTPGHLIDGENLTTQLAAKGLQWRGYMEDIPAPGSLAIFSAATATAPAQLYAAKHTGFTNFASVHADRNLARELVGFDALHRDLAAGTLPAFACRISVTRCTDATPGRMSPPIARAARR